MNVVREVGWRRVLTFVIFELWSFGFWLMVLPPLRVWWLRLGGARVGANVVIHRMKFINMYARGLAGISVGDDCFIGNDVMLDCADRITLERHVTIAMRALLITHMNVGYRRHPLQEVFPRTTKPILLKEGSFVGANVTILPGVTVGEESCIGAAALVTKDIPGRSLVGGVPAKVIRKIHPRHG